ncbi:MAG: outer membrane protein assembly factor BamE [Betaproteobacteria bacterium]|nr:outer membrane protein assembly factor BamE [Betaproteobacteria bacterium]
MPSLCRSFAAAALVLALAACGSKITEDNFAKIHEGMTRDEVTGILGEPTESSSVDILGVSGSSATWTDKRARITIQFVNDKVRLKSFSKPDQER